MLTVECKVHFEIGSKTRKKLEVGDAPSDPEALVEPGRLPRVARLMAWRSASNDCWPRAWPATTPTWPGSA